MPSIGTAPTTQKPDSNPFYMLRHFPPSAWCIIAMAGLHLLPLVAFISTAIVSVPPTAFAGQSPMMTAPVPDNNTCIPIMLGMMSCCPDVLLCEAVLDGVLKETWDIVDINLSFVSKYVSPLLLIHLVPDMLH